MVSVPFSVYSGTQADGDVMVTGPGLQPLSRKCVESSGALAKVTAVSLTVFQPQRERCVKPAALRKGTREGHELSSFVIVIWLELFSSYSAAIQQRVLNERSGSSRCYFPRECMYLCLALDTLASKEYEDQPFLPE
ncbi:uncharacterized [Tachysurus ichikawai]